jgi:hypothetical protein
MGGHFHGWRKCVVGLIALTALAALPAAASAEDLYFRNDTDKPIIVQGSCIIRGKVVNGRPNLLQPGDKSRITLPGNKVINIRDARAPNRLLHRDTVPAGKEDLYILISTDAGKLKLDKTTAKEYAGNKN